MQAMMLVTFVRGHMSGAQLRLFFKAIIVVAAGVVFLAVIVLTYAGIIAPWFAPRARTIPTCLPARPPARPSAVRPADGRGARAPRSGRFYSLWDTSYARIHIPIISSVSEHQPTTWPSFFFDLHVLLLVFPAGLWLLAQRMTDESVFVLLYAVFAAYFAGVMVRLMLTLTPIVCVVSAVAFSRLLRTYVFYERDTPATVAAADRADGAGSDAPADRRAAPKMRPKPQPQPQPAAAQPMPWSVCLTVLGFAMILLTLYAAHATWVTSNAYSSPSVVLAYHRYGAPCAVHVLSLFSSLSDGAPPRVIGRSARRGRRRTDGGGCRQWALVMTGRIVLMMAAARARGPAPRRSRIRGCSRVSGAQPRRTARDTG